MALSTITAGVWNSGHACKRRGGGTFVHSNFDAPIRASRNFTWSGRWRWSGWGTVRQKKTRGRRLTPESQQKTWRGQWRSGKGFDGERFQCLLFYGFEFWVLHSAHKEEIK
eukprot:scaffold5837_cov76-Cyclotella_meneghiniana.AAC.7